MPDFDEILNQKLNDLERGAVLEDVIKTLPPEAQDLAPLLRLASAVRSLPHPEPAANRVTLQREQVMAAAIRNTQPVRQRMPQLSWGERIMQKWQWLGAGAVLSAAGAVMVLLALMVFGIGLWFSARNMNTAKVEGVTGQVQVSTNPAGTAWKNISTGYRLSQGDRLRTLGASSATLAFFEGTHTYVASNADLTFTSLHGSGSGRSQTLQVKIDQVSGETYNSVTPFGSNKQSFFLVQTPSGTASVHGTQFNVLVSQNGLARFAVTTGMVSVQNASREVTLNAGQATAANPSGAIADPTYQFSIQGSLTDIDETTQIWTISGLHVQVTPETAIDLKPQLGSIVNVSGRILADQTRVADSIDIAGSQDETAYFTGTLESHSGSLWQVSGTTVSVTGDTVLAKDLADGNPVKVSFNLLGDGTVLATRIDSLLERSTEATQAPTLTADPAAKPEYAFVPDEVETSACGSGAFDLTSALRNTAGSPADYAANVKLGYLIDAGGEYVDTVTLTPASFSRLDAGKTGTFNIHVTTSQKWAQAASDAEIKLRVFIASATNQPNRLNGHMTVTINAGCPKTATPSTAVQTPEESLTPEATPAETLTPSTEAQKNATSGECVGADPQPTGMRLAQRYGVPYEEIMGWFCQHYGFGEIDLAYTLSRDSGQPVATIFALRASGVGWGNVKKQVEPAKNHKNNANGQGQNNNSQGNNGNGKGNNK